MAVERRVARVPVFPVCRFDFFFGDQRQQGNYSLTRCETQDCLFWRWGKAEKPRSSFGLIMHHVRISVSVALCILASAVLGVDENSAVGTGIDNLEVPSLNPLTQPTTLDPNSLVALNNVASDNGAPDDNTPNAFALDDKTPNTFTLDDFAPNQENVGSVGTLKFPNLDISGLTEGMTAISDSENCAGNLGKREDSGLTIGHYSFPKPSIFTALND